THKGTASSSHGDYVPLNSHGPAERGVPARAPHSGADGRLPSAPTTRRRRRHAAERAACRKRPPRAPERETEASSGPRASTVGRPVLPPTLATPPLRPFGLPLAARLAHSASRRRSGSAQSRLREPLNNATVRLSAQSSRDHVPACAWRR